MLQRKKMLRGARLKAGRALGERGKAVQGVPHYAQHRGNANAHANEHHRLESGVLLCRSAKRAIYDDPGCLLQQDSCGTDQLHAARSNYISDEHCDQGSSTDPTLLSCSLLGVSHHPS